MQVLCGLQVLFLLFNCQTPASPASREDRLPLNESIAITTFIPLLLVWFFCSFNLFDYKTNPFAVQRIFLLNNILTILEGSAYNPVFDS